jgi:hypothetical protein
MGRKPFDRVALRDDALPLRDRGMSYRDIGKQLGVSEGIIRSALGAWRVDPDDWTGREVCAVAVMDDELRIVRAVIEECEGGCVTVKRCRHEPFKSQPTLYRDECAFTPIEAWQQYAERQKATLRGLYQRSRIEEGLLKHALRELGEL